TSPAFRMSAAVDAAAIMSPGGPGRTRRKWTSCEECSRLLPVWLLSWPLHQRRRKRGGRFSARSRRSVIHDHAAVWIERNRPPAGLPEDVEKVRAHLLRARDVVGHVREIVHLVRIGPQIEQLVDVPHAVIPDELVLIASQRERRRCLRKVPLPVVLVQQLCS